MLTISRRLKYIGCVVALLAIAGQAGAGPLAYGRPAANNRAIDGVARPSVDSGGPSGSVAYVCCDRFLHPSAGARCHCPKSMGCTDIDCGLAFLVIGLGLSELTPAIVPARVYAMQAFAAPPSHVPALLLPPPLVL